MRVINSEIGQFHIFNGDVYQDNKKLEYIDKGAESFVYRYNDKVLKLYRKTPQKRVLSEEMINKLKSISTKRIVMPEGTLYEDSKVKGLYMPYIDGNREDIYAFPKEKLLEEFSYIFEDLSNLGQHSIVIDDLRMSNFLCNQDAFYLIDTGDYYISQNIKDTTRVNKDSFRTFTFNDIIAKSMRENGVKEEMPLREILGKFRKEKFLSYKKYEENILEYLKDNMEEKETLSEYGKRLIKK